MATVSRTDRPAKPVKVSPEILDRQPPCSLDSERGVLGSILLLPEVCDDVALVIRPDDFHDEAHQKLFAHMLAIHNEGRHVDVTLLFERLRQAGDLEFCGGASYLHEIVQGVPTAANAAWYAQIIRDKAIQRSLILASTEILRDAYDDRAEARELLGRAESKIFSILQTGASGQLYNLADVLTQTMDRVDARMKHDHQISGVETHFVDLDNLLGGLHNSQLVVLAARPSMGKTALALNIATNVAIDGQNPVLFVSLEMGALELGDRVLCSVAKVNGHRMRNGTLSQDDRRRLVEKAGVISSAPLYVDDSPNRTVTEIAATARRLKRKHGLSLIVLDYLQLVEPDNSKDPRQEQVAKITRRLKLMARELQVPVLCLAQLNRQAEMGKEGNRPRLSHLRESGAIEQDADVVMFIHREEYYRQNEEERQQVAGQAEVIVAKQRNGPVDEVKLTWLKDFMRFENSAQYAPHDDLASFPAADDF